MPRSLVVAFIALASCALAACSRTAPAPEAAAATAPAAATEAPASANVHAFRVGELEAMALRDGELELPNDNQVFGIGMKPEDVAAVLSAAGLATDKLSLGLDPLLVKSPGKLLLFDTGAGAMMGPTAGKLPATLSEAGIDPATITDIFISHSHGDHVGGLIDASGALAYPNATIHISRPEWEYLGGQKEMAPLVAAMKPRVDAFAPGAELLPRLVTAVPVQGHTPGHSAYRITSGADSLLYIGDSMHHLVVSVQKPEWTIAFDGDKALATASRVALIDELARSGQRVYAHHFPFPGVGKITKGAEGARWLPE